ncbi:Cytochrome C oxidase, cbb3-type, subunit III [Gillisia sp. Hel1_33_143]|uniref:c-type cytochrome n=1 Tax=Gillisia sp. Hel1_33_143 TaxID=1336796 RepID=UPI00087A3AAE|nr:cytochrome c [Gillisia sp. Hel1_33_143]SDR72151.1 Cytochrome C oxidase, cbb3-type, subunit III [Gillisia sp. Hel1_33_143]
MKSLFHRSIVLLLVAVTATSCFNKERPNYQYFPDMYEPVGYEAYGEYDVFEDQQEAKSPVEGTIPRGWTPYEYENSNEGSAKAKAELTNPIPYTEENLAAGQQLYTVYCAVCHGDKGNGKGILVEREKILGVPSYDDQGRAITEGSVYHAMYYGLNAMGSYASQTTINERWQIDHYVMKLKGALEGKPERSFDTPENAAKTELIPAVNAEPSTSMEQASTADQAKESTN